MAHWIPAFDSAQTIQLVAQTAAKENQALPEVDDRLFVEKVLGRPLLPQEETAYLEAYGAALRREK